MFVCGFFCSWDSSVTRPVGGGRRLLPWGRGVGNLPLGLPPQIKKGGAALGPRTAQNLKCKVIDHMSVFFFSKKAIFYLLQKTEDFSHTRDHKLLWRMISLQK